MIEQAILDIPEETENHYLKLLENHFHLLPIKTAARHKKALEFIDVLMTTELPSNCSEWEADEIHGYMSTLGMLIEQYENEKWPMNKSSPVEILLSLMEDHGLTQSDFMDEIGPQPSVSRIISGERELTAKHIQALCKRFGLKADAFLP